MIRQRPSTSNRIRHIRHPVKRIAHSMTRTRKQSWRQTGEQKPSYTEQKHSGEGKADGKKAYQDGEPLFITKKSLEYSNSSHEKDMDDDQATIDSHASSLSYIHGSSFWPSWSRWMDQKLDDWDQSLDRWAPLGCQSADPHDMPRFGCGPSHKSSSFKSSTCRDQTLFNSPNEAFTGPSFSAAEYSSCSSLEEQESTIVASFGEEEEEEEEDSMIAQVPRYL